MRVIQTERLILRDFVEADWDAVNAMLSDSEATRYMHFAQWSAEQRREWFDWCIENSQSPTPDAYNWAIVHKETAQTIGWFGIGSASRPAVDGERDFGYLLARPMWGHGYMTEALQAILPYEFDTLKTPYISATCETANPASARVMEKAGMRHIKTVRDSDSEGNWAERHHYAIHNPHS
jgi:ribosomal-protein-alanine N-acetyltransferase